MGPLPPDASTAGNRKNVMKELSSAQRQYLKGLAHHLKPVVQIGKNGLTDQVMVMIESALNAHELIKLKFIDFQEQKKEFSEEIVHRSSSERVGMVGNTLVIFRQHTDPEKRKISLPS